jgi:hypothetical protein
MPIHLKPGQDRQTILENTRLLIKAGHEKGEALATALNLAGYRPPDLPSSTKPLRMNLARVKALILKGASATTAFRQAARENAKAIANAVSGASSTKPPSSTSSPTPRVH